MHELSIASTIVDAVLQEMQRRGISRIVTIALRIGRMTDVDTDALSFGFDVITRDTLLAGTALAIEPIPITVRCTNCQAESEVENYLFVCPACGSSRVTMLRGTELDIAYLEIEDESSPAKATQEAG